MNNFRKIPELFPKGCSLKKLGVTSNQLEGPIPNSLVNCHNLEVLQLSHNEINDTFPSWLGNLKNLQILMLGSNRLYGHIPNPELASSFHHLQIIDLSDNYFSGRLPMKFFRNLHAMINGSRTKGKAAEYVAYDYSNIRVHCEEDVSVTIKGLEMKSIKLLTALTIIDFSNNQFIGEIPGILGQLGSLIVLNLSHNSLTGLIPSSFGNLSNLESLDLSSTKLQGNIPQPLVNLDFLQVLDLSWNNLTGLIPRGNHFDTFGSDSFIGNSGLCGFAVSKDCNSDPDLGSPPSKFGDTSSELNWKFSILMGYGCGLAFGLSMGYIVFTTEKPWWFILFIERVQHKYIID